MLAAERHSILLNRLAEEGKLIAKDIAAELGLSDDTVRRDLRELAAAGLCQRVYGGALPVPSAAADYAARASVQPDSKDRIARCAARFIGQGSTVILDGGTTTLAVVRALAPSLSCTVITHSPTIAAALVPHAGIDVFLLGGRLFKHSAVTCGAAAVEAAQTISADLFLLGVTGVHSSEGLTTGDVEEAAMKRALAGRAADTYVLASTEKIGVASRYQVLPLNAIAGIITDRPHNDPTLSELRKDGTTLIDADA
ncbi:DeoR/GlpR family DNA-binding transcription regulator [Arthrobacter sp. TMN-49]